MRSISVYPFCVYIIGGGGERREKNIAFPMIHLCVYDCVCRHFRFRPRGNSRKTICVSTQTINNRRRRSRTRWFMVNLNWIFIRWHAWICARHGTRGRASRLVFAARWFQLCQSYPDRMHFAKIYCPRAFMPFLSMCACGMQGNLSANNRNKFNTIYIIYRKFHLKLNWQKRRIVSINFGLHADYNLFVFFYLAVTR